VMIMTSRSSAALSQRVARLALAFV